MAVDRLDQVISDLTDLLPICLHVLTSYLRIIDSGANPAVYAKCRNQ